MPAFTRRQYSGAAAATTITAVPILAEAILAPVAVNAATLADAMLAPVTCALPRLAEAMLAGIGCNLF